MFKGVAGEVQLPSGYNIDGVVAEVLGHFGSSEGFVKILRDIGVRYCQELPPLKAVVPAVFGTAVVPVGLCSMKERFTVMCLGPTVALVKNFPFRSAMLDITRVAPQPGEQGHDWGVAFPLPDGHSFMEMYNSKDLVSSSTQSPVEFTFKSEWIVNKEGFLDSLAMYVVYGDSVEGPFFTSNQDEGVTYTCWGTVLVPIPFTLSKFRCDEGDRIELTSVCRVLLEEEPSYLFTLIISDSLGRESVKKEIAVHYRDLVCRVVPLRNVVQHVAA